MENEIYLSYFGQYTVLLIDIKTKLFTDSELKQSLAGKTIWELT